MEAAEGHLISDGDRSDVFGRGLLSLVLCRLNRGWHTRHRPGNHVAQDLTSGHQNKLVGLHGLGADDKLHISALSSVLKHLSAIFDELVFLQMIEQNDRVVESRGDLNRLNFRDHLFIGFHKHAESFKELLLIQEILRLVLVLFFVDEAANLLFRIRFIATIAKA